MEIQVHPRVRKYLNESGEKEKLIAHIKRLADDPYNSRPEADITKLKGKKHDLHRLRVGDHRIEYFVDEEKIWIDRAFQRGRGYR